MKIKILITLIISSSFLFVNAQYTKLFDFTGTASGCNPYGTFTSDGTFLYGMTTYGGTNDMGVIFKIMPDEQGIQNY